MWNQQVKAIGAVEDMEGEGAASREAAGPAGRRACRMSVAKPGQEASSAAELEVEGGAEEYVGIVIGHRVRASLRQ